MEVDRFHQGKSLKHGRNFNLASTIQVVHPQLALGVAIHSIMISDNAKPKNNTNQGRLQFITIAGALFAWDN